MERAESGAVAAVVLRDELASLAAALLAEGRTVRFVARGGSMAPFIRDGEPVLIGPLRRPPRPGEVVLVRGAEGVLLLHRVVRCSQDGVVTRGDATVRDDPPVAGGDVLGRAQDVSGRRRLHLGATGGSLLLCWLALCRGPLRPLARGARALQSRIHRQASSGDPRSARTRGSSRAAPVDMPWMR